jgi:CRISPR/Cas system-associated exonuclease Cas4 (RecB family)
MIIDLIDKYYQDKHSDRIQEHFYITDSGRCPRTVYFSMKKYPKKQLEARALRIFDRGDIIHQRIMSVLLAIPEVRVVSSEIDIPVKELFHGRADAVISVDRKLYVVEIKSSGDFKFRKLKEPEIAHKKQIQLYMHFFKIPQGMIIYENKNTQELKEFIESYDSKFCKKIISDFEELKYQIENEILPDVPLEIKEKREQGNKPWECEYCDYKESCVKAEKNK